MGLGQNYHKTKFLTIIITTVLIGGMLNTIVPISAGSQSGTTLSAEKTATGAWIRTFDWTISKTVVPTTLELLVGDEGNPEYTVSVDKTGSTDVFKVSGQVCVTNGGAVTTENLKLVDQVQYKIGPGMFQNLAGASQTIIPVAQLGPGESQCYDYEITFTPVAGATYRNSVKVTITNHSGHLGDEFGPEPKADFSLPSSPTLVNNEINVDDTNGQSWGPVSDDTTWMYNKEFLCPDDTDYNHDNTATIFETQQSDGATVSVTCHELSVRKTATTSFTRDYDWTIDKSADTAAINVQVNQDPVTVNYDIDVGSSFADSAHAVSGSITINNPASYAAPLNSVSDKVNDAVDATVDCNGATTVPAHGSLVCTYNASLGGPNDGTNKATATIDNYDRTDPNNPVPLGITTDFMGTAAVTFGNPTTVQDQCVTLGDDNPEGPQALQICAADTPTNVSYPKNFGPFPEAGTSSHTNTACIATDDGQPKCDAVTIPITVSGPVPPGGNPGEGCTLTQGYWKSHTGANFNGFQHLQLQNLIDAAGGSISLGTMEITTVEEANAVFLAAQGDDLIAKLKSQLLAAILNILSSADGTDIEDTIDDADAFLSANSVIPKGKTGSALRAEATALISALDAYNNGDIGPGHCTS